MKIKTSSLSGTPLDWAVAQCEGKPQTLMNFRDGKGYRVQFGIPLICYSPSTDWSQGGPIIEREKVEVKQPRPCVTSEPYRAFIPTWPVGGLLETYQHYGKTYLEASMRCYVASKLGDEVEIPEELL